MDMKAVQEHKDSSQNFSLLRQWLNGGYNYKNEYQRTNELRLGVPLSKAWDPMLTGFSNMQAVAAGPEGLITTKTKAGHNQDRRGGRVLSPDAQSQ